MAAENGVRVSGMVELDNALSEMFRTFGKNDSTGAVRKAIRNGGAKIIRDEVKQNILGLTVKLGNKVAKAYALKNTKDSEGNPGIKLYARRSGQYKDGGLVSIFEGGAVRSKRGTIRAQRFVERALISRGNEAHEATGRELIKITEAIFNKRLKK